MVDPKKILAALKETLEELNENKFDVPVSVFKAVNNGVYYLEKYVAAEETSASTASIMKASETTESIPPPLAIQEIAKSILKMYQDVGKTIERIAWKA